MNSLFEANEFEPGGNADERPSGPCSLFGFDFQVNAAIILMLENIKELKSLRLEGEKEDIELTLENGEKILAQAKIC